MGITIDKAIEFFDGLEGHTPQAKDARNVAIDTMRKYKKIEKIVKEWRESGLLQDKFYDLINEVLEDGNDD